MKTYLVLQAFPSYKQFNLTDQLRRAVVSIPTNIVEGCSKDTQKELIRYLYISSGSTHEVEYLLLLSKDLGYLKEIDYLQLQEDVVSIKKCLQF
ncbi:four helix bundle protein [Myroides sp. C20-1]|uniref:four helix bundle protein n=1 Tax=Myroides sp. C20-1 TaxID=3400534 RepID=UPI003D2F6C5D